MCGSGLVLGRPSSALWSCVALVLELLTAYQILNHLPHPYHNATTVPAASFLVGGDASTGSRLPQWNVTVAQALLQGHAVLDPSGILVPSWNPSVSYCSWQGVTCSPDGSHAVTQLSLGLLGLSGQLPQQWSVMHDLQYMDVSSNNLSGTLPTSWSALSSLAILDVSNNSLEGGLPAAWLQASHAKLLYLGLHGNSRLCGERSCQEALAAGSGLLTSLQLITINGGQALHPAWCHCVAPEDTPVHSADKRSPLKGGSDSSASTASNTSTTTTISTTAHIMCVGAPPVFDDCMRDTCHSAAVSTPHTCPVRYSHKPFSLPVLLANRTHAAGSAAAAHSSAHTSDATSHLHDTDDTTSYEYDADATSHSDDTDDTTSYEYDADDTSYAYDTDDASYAYNAVGDISYDSEADDASYSHDTYDTTSYDYDAADTSYAYTPADDTSYSHDSEADSASYDYDYDDADGTYSTATYEGDYDSTDSTDSTPSDADSLRVEADRARLGWGDVLRGLLRSAWPVSQGSAHLQPAARQHEVWARQLSELLSEKQYMLGGAGEGDPCTQLRRSDAAARWLQRSRLMEAAGYVVCSLVALVALCFAVATRKQMACARERVVRGLRTAVDCSRQQLVSASRVFSAQLAKGGRYTVSQHLISSTHTISTLWTRGRQYTSRHFASASKAVIALLAKGRQNTSPHLASASKAVNAQLAKGRQYTSQHLSTASSAIAAQWAKGRQLSRQKSASASKAVAAGLGQGRQYSSRQLAAAQELLAEYGPKAIDFACRSAAAAALMVQMLVDRATAAQEPAALPSGETPLARAMPAAAAAPAGAAAPAASGAAAGVDAASMEPELEAAAAAGAGAGAGDVLQAKCMEAPARGRCKPSSDTGPAVASPGKVLVPDTPDPCADATLLCGDGPADLAAASDAIGAVAGAPLELAEAAAAAAVVQQAAAPAPATEAGAAAPEAAPEAAATTAPAATSALAELPDIPTRPLSHPESTTTTTTTTPALATTTTATPPDPTPTASSDLPDAPFKPSLAPLAPLPAVTASRSNHSSPCSSTSRVRLASARIEASLLLQQQQSSSASRLSKRDLSSELPWLALAQGRYQGDLSGLLQLLPDSHSPKKAGMSGQGSRDALGRVAMPSSRTRSLAGRFEGGGSSDGSATPAGAGAAGAAAAGDSDGEAGAGGAGAGQGVPSGGGVAKGPSQSGDSSGTGRSRLAAGTAADGVFGKGQQGRPRE